MAEPIYLLTPLRFCEMRTRDADGETEECVRFADQAIQGMAFCAVHGPLIHESILEDNVKFLDYLPGQNAASKPSKEKK